MMQNSYLCDYKLTQEINNPDFLGIFLVKQSYSCFGEWVSRWVLNWICPADQSLSECENRGCDLHCWENKGKLRKIRFLYHNLRVWCDNIHLDICKFHAGKPFKVGKLIINAGNFHRSPLSNLILPKRLHQQYHWVFHNNKSVKGVEWCFDCV